MIYLSIYLYLYIYIYKNIRPPSTMQKKYIIYNLLIMKIRYMKDKA